MSLKSLKPTPLWSHFEAINTIPRASKKEQKICAFIFDFGTSLGLKTTIDKTGNIIICKPGTKGRENNKTVVLQGHVDMVHQKEITSKIDFDKQGIEMYVEGDWVKANGTTLGADNGIGVAAIMAVLSSKTVEHPPLQALFTVDEEVGMTGAMALKSTQLQGDFLLNLDSEEDDILTIGCAGGVDVSIDKKYTLDGVSADKYAFYELTLKKLRGGHSGVDIHLESANAILVLAKLLETLTIKVSCQLHSFHVGTLTNVIPRDGVAVLAIPVENVSHYEKIINTCFKTIKRGYQESDPEMLIENRRLSGNYDSVMSMKDHRHLINGLLQMPNGVQTITPGNKRLVETSNNVALIRCDNGAYTIKCHARSSVDAKRDDVVKRIQKVFHGERVTQESPYPGWEPKLKSELLAVAVNCYEKLHNTTPKIESIHAGLECGILSGTYPKMQMISFGPTILGAHSPQERVKISSVQKFWEFLVYLLKTIQ